MSTKLCQFCPPSCWGGVLDYLSFRDFLHLKQVCKDLSVALPAPLYISHYKSTIISGVTTIEDLGKGARGADVCRFSDSFCGGRV